MKEIKPLEEVLSYENDGLVRLFSARKQMAIDESKLLFQEMKKLLWFMAQRSTDAGPFVMFSEQGILDDYWHEFILITKAYHEFCDTYFGRYIHHAPHLDGIAMDGSGFGIPTALATTDKNEYIARKLAILRQMMTEVAATLGPEIVKVWYDDLPKKYFYPLHGGASS